jgi:hypothetical protein
MNDEFLKHIEKVANKEMTRAEQSDLLKITRLREKVAKTAASSRSAQLRAEFEQQMATRYPFDTDEVWKEVALEMQKVKDEAQARVSARSKELGIPKAFAPDVHWYWNNEGQRACKERVIELRRIAATQIKAIEKDAQTKIELASADIQTKLLAAGLKSVEANAFLESMPTVEALMPPLKISNIEGLLDGMNYRERRKLLKG